MTTVVRNDPYRAGYHILEVTCPSIVRKVLPGQFVHLRVPRLEGCVLRRPFSIFRAEGDSLSILYKTVGKGTDALARVEKGEKVNIIGPLGNGFPVPAAGAVPVAIAGGYGVAPLSLLARNLNIAGMAFIGGASASDVLCREDFTRSGWGLEVTTVDGSEGRRGVVTDALDAWLAARPAEAPPIEVYACGPDGMLKAVGARALARGFTAWLSLDKRMGCGMGACLACVQRIRRDDGSEWLARVCRDGPVFEAGEIVWE